MSDFIKVKILKDVVIEEVVVSRHRPSIEYIEHSLEECSWRDGNFNSPARSESIHYLPITELCKYIKTGRHGLSNWPKDPFDEPPEIERKFIALTPTLRKHLEDIIVVIEEECYTKVTEQSHKHAGEILKLKVAKDSMANQLYGYENMTFWQRLKFLFKGGV